MAAVVITEANFEEEVLKADKPVLVDFWASWCGPCKMLSPVVEEIASENDKVKIGKVNVDEEGDLAAKYNIMSIPSLLLFKDGKLVNQSVGVVPKAEILDMINKV